VSAVSAKPGGTACLLGPVAQCAAVPAGSVLLVVRSPTPAWNLRAVRPTGCLCHSSGSTLTHQSAGSCQSVPLQEPSCQLLRVTSCCLRTGPLCTPWEEQQQGPQWSLTSPGSRRPAAAVGTFPWWPLWARVCVLTAEVGRLVEAL
jgi:hypothetical protein